ncbi:hypothetical protein Dda_0603 [Drechslerella dactyloides]|uniref:Invertebrate defensins family profile domain-containing protein n=1 Tax=Drechslerella dactyloides TaxID=74499 RepID=A0AAD6NN62_DREDA|nr:hypothetical protein Dda_0603 [Drechslerella dactyloides]
MKAPTVLLTISFLVAAATALVATPAPYHQAKAVPAKLEARDTCDIASCSILCRNQYGVSGFCQGADCKCGWEE